MSASAQNTAVPSPRRISANDRDRPGDRFRLNGSLWLKVLKNYLERSEAQD